MDLALTGEQERIRWLARDFALGELQPTAALRDEEESFDRGLFDRMGRLGLTGIPWPAAYGGSGADDVAFVMAVEELSRVCASTGVMLSVHTSLVSWAIYTYGTEEQKIGYLRALSEGRKLGAFSLTENDSGSDAVAMKTTARRDGDGYALNGTKMFVTSGGEADVYLVFAVTDPPARKSGCSAFLVEKGTPGFAFGKKERKLGLRSSPTLELLFDGCRIPGENLLGREGEGFAIAMSSLHGGRCGIAAQAVGIAQGALDAAIAWMKERNGTAGTEHPAACKIAGIAARIQAARLLTWRAAWRKSAGLPYEKEAAHAKLFASDTAVQATSETLLLTAEAGSAFTGPVERYFRDAKVTQIYEGTNEIQRLIISRMLLAE